MQMQVAGLSNYKTGTSYCNRMEVVVQHTGCMDAYGLRLCENRWLSKYIEDLLQIRS
jgi:hypothetical protein